jgi:hypothetical protein
VHLSDAARTRVDQLGFIWVRRDEHPIERAHACAHLVVRGKEGSSSEMMMIRPFDQLGRWAPSLVR